MLFVTTTQHFISKLTHLISNDCPEENSSHSWGSKLKEWQRMGERTKRKKPKPHQPLQNWDSLPNMRILSHKEETDVHGWNLHVALFSSRIQ